MPDSRKGIAKTLEEPKRTDILTFHSELSYPKSPSAAITQPYFALASLGNTTQIDVSEFTMLDTPSSHLNTDVKQQWAWIILVCSGPGNSRFCLVQRW